MRYLVLVILLLGASSLIAAKSLGPQDHLKSGGNESIQCLVCEAVVYIVDENVLSKVASESDMQALIRSLCVNYTHNFTTPGECLLIGEYLGAQLWKIKGMQPNATCAMMKVCAAPIHPLPAKTSDLTADNSQVKDQPVGCVFCEAGMNLFIKQVAPTVKSKKQMEDLVTSFCMRLRINGTTPNQCALMGKRIGDELWEYKNYSPNKACQELQACPKSDGFTPAKVDIVGMLQDVLGAGPKNSSIECKACQDVIGAVKALVIADEPSLVKEIESLFCDHLPQSTATECRKAVEQDLPTLLEKYLSPEEVCSVLLKVC